jgi:hypothetical protein
MLKAMVLLWVISLGASLVGFGALVVLQGIAGRFRPKRRAAKAAAPACAASVATSTPVLAVRVEQSRQVAEPLAG